MPALTEKSVRRAVFRNGTEQYPALFAVKRADTLAQSTFQREEKLAAIDAYEKLYEGIIEKQQCLSIRDLAVSGSDLIALGMEPGKAIGEMLGALLDAVLEDPSLNTKEKLIQQVHNLKTPHI